METLDDLFRECEYLVVEYSGDQVVMSKREVLSKVNTWAVIRTYWKTPDEEWMWRFTPELIIGKVVNDMNNYPGKYDPKLMRITDNMMIPSLNPPSPQPMINQNSLSINIGQSLFEGSSGFFDNMMGLR